MLRGALPALSSHLETHNLHFKIILCRYFPLETLEGGAVKLLDPSATKAGEMQMVFLSLNLVIVLFSVEVHQVELIDQPKALEQFQGPVDGRTIDIGISLASERQESRRIKMRVRTLDGFD